MFVIEVLEFLLKEKLLSLLRFKILERGGENRGIYILDEVSYLLEKVKQRGFFVVDVLGQFIYVKDGVFF